MASPDMKAKIKRYGLLASAAVLLLAGGVALYVGSSQPAIRPIGLGACLLSVLLVRTANSTAKMAPSQGEVIFKPKTGPSRSLWVTSLVLVPIVALAILYLWNDAAHGYHDVLPVYVFAGTGIVCTAVWSYLASQITR